MCLLDSKYEQLHFCLIFLSHFLFPSVLLLLLFILFFFCINCSRLFQSFSLCLMIWFACPQSYICVLARTSVTGYCYWDSNNFLWLLRMYTIYNVHCVFFCKTYLSFMFLYVPPEKETPTNRENMSAHSWHIRRHKNDVLIRARVRRTEIVARSEVERQNEEKSYYRNEKFDFGRKPLKFRQRSDV